MFEAIILFVIMFLVAACVFYSMGGSMLFLSKAGQPLRSQSVGSAASQKHVHGETYNFLSHLKNEIEAELFPRPTDSVLRRHYDALVAVELENRLALMAE